MAAGAGKRAGRGTKVLASLALSASVLLGLAAGCEPAQPEGASRAPLGRLPARAGVTYRFQPLLGPVPSADRFTVTVSAWAFPGPVAVRWTGGFLPNQGKQRGRRRLTTLAKGKRFEPIFVDGEDNKVSATAPWVSSAVYRQLSQGKTVSGFFEGGLSLSGQVTGDTEGIQLVPVKGRTYFACRLDGRLRRIKAISVNEGAFLIADDPADPIVLHYQTVGVGWRLVEVETPKSG